MKIKIIYYDASFSVGKFRGMGKYINNFVKSFDEFKDLQITGLLPSKKLFNINSSKLFSFGFSNYILWEQISLLFFIKKNRNNSIFIFPYNTAPIFIKRSSNNILIIHDLIFMNNYRSKSLKQLLGNCYRKFVLPLVVKRFTNIITVSEYSKSQIIKFFNLPESKVIVFPNSIDFNISNISENIPLSFKKNYFFHIGGEPDYKNTITVVRAFSLLPQSIRDEYNLKILGIRESKTLSYYNKLILDLNLTNSIELLPFISDEDIDYYYKNAKLFIFPSKDEGFGIPIIESMKYGCPLICSKASCIPEIAGEAALYFDPYSPKDLADKIVELLDNKNLAENMILSGYDILKKYSHNIVKKNIFSWSKITFDL